MEELQDKSQHIAAQSRIAGELTAEIKAARAAGARLFVISNEHCHSRLDTEASVRRVHDLLAPLFRQMQVLVFVRPQIDVCLSLASTLARMGNEVSRARFDAQMRPAATYFNMHTLLTRWATVFGRANIAAIAFRRQPDTVRCVEHKLGVADLGLPRAKPSNEALDYRVIAMTNAMGIKAHEGAGINQSRKFFVNELPVQERLSLDRASAQSLQARFDDSNAALCADWPEIALSDMTPDWNRYPEVGNIDQVQQLEPFGPYLRAIVERFNAELWFVKARQLSITAERDVLRENLEQALRVLEQAVEAALLASKAETLRPRTDNMLKTFAARRSRLERRLKKAGGKPLGPQRQAMAAALGEPAAEAGAESG